MAEELKEYKAMVWVGDSPGQRVTVLAKSLAEASKELEARYGEGNVYYIRNEEDADRPR